MKPSVGGTPLHTQKAFYMFEGALTELRMGSGVLDGFLGEEASDFCVRSLGEVRPKKQIEREFWV